MSKTLFITNLLFLVPLGLAVWWGVWWYVVVLGVSFGLSWMYHFSQEKRYIKTDFIFSLGLIYSNCALLYTGGLTPVPLAASAVFVAALALLVYFRQYKNYRSYHSTYHVLSAVVCVLCLLVFYY